MDRSNLLRDALFVADGADSDLLCERINEEDHPFVFARHLDDIFPIKSFGLVLALQSGQLTSWLAEQFRTIPPVKMIPFEDLPVRVLDVLSEEVTLVEYAGVLKYVLREDFLLKTVTGAYEIPNSDTAWLRSLFSSIPRGLMIVDLSYAVVNSNQEALRMLRIQREQLSHIRLNELLGSDGFQWVRTTRTALLNQLVIAKERQAGILVDFVPLVSNQILTGFALVLQDLPSVEMMAMELDSVKQLNQDMETILSTIYDEIIVVDVSGTLLRASDHYIAAHWRKPPQQLIGENVLRSKAADTLICNVIRDVRQSEQKVSLMENESEYPLLSVGNPIFTKNGKLDRIVVASRDLTELAQLKRELEKTRKQSENYRQELEQLKHRVSSVNGVVPVYTSAAMHEVMQEAERVAQFSTSVLLSGESGVGKEVIANAIHSFSTRRDGPFVKINCAAIPESLLESELFGYEKGAFSGAKNEGKQGLFLKAHQGTLFLDEISELPYGLQSKLLRALQEREVYPVGGTTPVKFDVQIIAAANRSLEDLVERGEFRSDLFYRIHVFPIEVPPLRARKEDIAVLSNHFLCQFNEIYRRNLRLSSEAIEILEAYRFPGNVRELQNLIQRIAIRSDRDVVGADNVERVLMGRMPLRGMSAMRFSQVVPLKTAFEQIENELISLAMHTYRSTTKAAEVLGISQSSVSRKFKRIRDNAQTDAQPSRGPTSREGHSMRWPPDKSVR